MNGRLDEGDEGESEGGDGLKGRKEQDDKVVCAEWTSRPGIYNNRL